MSDLRRIVTLDAAGAATTVKDLEDNTSFFAVAGSFQVKPAESHVNWATIPRRFAGARPASETHDNGEISWKMLVRGATADLCIQNLEAAIGTVLTARTDLHFEWRPDGVTNSTFYEVRGPAKFTPTYQWAQFVGAQSMIVDIAIPVAPLPRGAPTSYPIASTTFPSVVALNAVPGDAPALADIALTTNGGASAPIWAYFAWTKRPGAPLGGSVAPFGIIEAESAFNFGGWAVTADATYRGGNGLKIATSGVGSANALWRVDPSVMQPDDFAAGEVDIEIWGVFDLPAAIVTPKVTMSFYNGLAPSTIHQQYSAEFGAAGKIITKPSTGSARRPVKLGTVSMPVDPSTPTQWNVQLDASWGGGSSGTFGLDYLWMAPARQSARGPTAKPNDAAYPTFIPVTTQATKTIRSDLSGMLAHSASNPGRDSGLGGSEIWLPPGNVDLLVVLSSVVPDDPTSNAASMQLSHTGVTGSVKVTPRYWLARGT